MSTQAVICLEVNRLSNNLSMLGWWKKIANSELPKGFRRERIGSVPQDVVSSEPAQIAEHFRTNPDQAKALLLDSYDKRYAPATFMEETGNGFRVGWYSPKEGRIFVREFCALKDAATDYLLFSLGRGRWTPPRTANPPSADAPKVG
jgi:hypothetical protein